MQRIKHPPLRNKIDLADPAQSRAWTRRLRVSADELKAIVEKAGNSVAAVSRQPCPVPPAAIPNQPAEGELATPA